MTLQQLKSNIQQKLGKDQPKKASAPKPPKDTKKKGETDSESDQEIEGNIIPQSMQDNPDYESVEKQSLYLKIQFLERENANLVNDKRDLSRQLIVEKRLVD
mmetsp:Transcript_6227/g.10147  ORF Transcript_6227/g.10147 Transcript_6227/m.10147 type:complete len:102 (+) Transcript_6227:163-468(+)